ncbi:CAAX prenyl protease 2 [Thrips palmi]|uniref:CAAX prenyl protease 2 n=1 Tax=Thrips palmi TaxID=161013 RepID=A0A6P8YN05_THRPL|nr:CAAX prenyl protease 2 [Thrips palmi]
MEAGEPIFPTCCTSIAACLFLSVAYVASLYIWGTRESRDDPAMIVKRFYSVFVMMFWSPLLVYICLDREVLLKTSLYHLLGFKLEGLVQALTIPLGLTMVLFLGSLSMQGLTGLWHLYTEPMYWVWNMKDIHFLRSHVVAPIAEEFVFRACMLPLLLQCFQPLTAIFIAPLFFGVAHLHHMYDRVMHAQLPFKHALAISCFQMTYTTIFGAYSAFLFVRTGHLAAPCVVHAFCNHMGFPDFSEVFTYKNPHKFIVASLFLVGLVAWCFLLAPLTKPSLYYNNLFWKE